MKKILFAAVAALAITGCSQNEEFDAPGKNEVINFNTAVGKAIRAAEANDATLQSSGFKLYTYNTVEANMANVVAGGLGDAFIDDAATYSASAWSLAKSYYWPLNENLQFFGYSPQSNVKDWATTGIYPSFSYTVQDTQEDLLAATVFDQKKTTVTPMGAIQLTFKHILTQINFALKGADAGFTYTVTEIKLENVPSKGTYTYDDATKGAWSGLELSKQYVYGGTYSKDFTNIAPCTITGTDRALMLIPNSDVTAVNAIVTYTTTNESTSKVVFNGSKKVALKGSWATGQKLLYTLTLPSGAEEITVTGKTDVWETEGGGTQEPSWVD